MKKYLTTLLILLITGGVLFAQTKKEAVDRSLQFLSNLEQRNFEANIGLMADSLATIEFDNKMKDAWDFQCERLGNYEALKSLKYDKFGNFEIVYLVCQFQKADYTLKFVFNKSLVITDVYFIAYPPIIPPGKLNTLWIIAFLILWELAWKALGLWKAAQNYQVKWFIVLFILPTAGLLPIIYVMFMKNHSKHT